MKITLISVGKTEEPYLKEGIEIYEKRIKHYLTFEHIVIPSLKNTKNMSVDQQKEKEGELILRHIKDTDKCILLDENGKQFTSVEFSSHLQMYMNSGVKNLNFIIGGPYGFSEMVYQKANDKIALSKLTFSHQMVRLFFVEQLYRSMTILKGESYHH